MAHGDRGFRSDAPNGRGEPFTSSGAGRVGDGGFTLIEILIALAIVGGLLVTLAVTLNHHLGIATDLERSARRETAALRLIETVAAEKNFDREEAAETRIPGEDNLTVRVSVTPAEGPVSFLGLRRLAVTVIDDEGGESSFDLWIR